MAETGFTIVISGFTVDTNILVYSIDRRDLVKHQVAVRIVAVCLKARHYVALQVLNEFFRTVTRKGLLPIPDAVDIVNDARSSLKIASPNESDLVQAMTSHQRLNLQFFDALLLATIERTGCTLLLSEDMQHERVYEGVQVLNPFKMSSGALAHLLT